MSDSGSPNTRCKASGSPRRPAESVEQALLGGHLLDRLGLDQIGDAAGHVRPRDHGMGRQFVDAHPQPGVVRRQ